MLRANRFWSLGRKVLPFLALLLVAVLAFSVLLFNNNQIAGMSAPTSLSAASGSAPEVGAAGAEPMGQITGTVTNLAGMPLPGIVITACNIAQSVDCEAELANSSNPFRTVTQPDDTEYLLHSMPPGEYIVRFVDGAGDVAPYPQYYNEADTIGDAEAVEVVSGQTERDINAKMMAYSHVTGRVLNSSTSGIEGIMVVACKTTPDTPGNCESPPWTQAWDDTDEDGYYDLKYALPGTYKILYQNYTNITPYLPEYYNNKVEFVDAAMVTVGIEANVVLSDTVLVEASRIQGYVRDAQSNDPIAGAHLTFIAHDGSAAFGHTTAGDGTYLTRDMASGVYTISVTGPGSDYMTKQLTFTVGEGAVETLDITLDKARKIHGFVTDAITTDAFANVYVSACSEALDCTEANNWDAHYAFSEASGAYEISGMTSGAYYVRFIPPINSGYLTEYHFDAFTLENAAAVPLFGPTYDVEISAEMNKAPSISGRVTARSGGEAIAGIQVNYCRKQGDECPTLNSTTTDSTGYYTITALLPGTYLLTFLDTDNVEPAYLNKVYDADTESLDGATEIVLTNSQVTGIDVQMVRGVTIVGSLLLPGGGPALGARATICQVNGGMCTFLNQFIEDVDASGVYTITGVRDGLSYHVQFRTPGIEYLDFYPASSGSAPVFSSLSALTLLPAPEAYIDLGTRTFPKAAKISGKVYDDDQAPLEGIVINPCYINLSDPCTIGGETTTNANGEYTIRGLRPSPPAYYLFASDPSGTHWAMYFGNVETIGAGTSVSVGLGEERTGVDIVLPKVDAAVTPTPPMPTPSATPPASATPPTPTPSATPSPTGGPTFTPTPTIDPFASPTPTLPPYGVSINSGALYTNDVNVSLSLAPPQGGTRIMVSNDGGFVGAAWEDFSPTRGWTITSHGSFVVPRTVYVRFGNSADSVLVTVQDDIILDITAPEGTVEVEDPIATAANASAASASAGSTAEAANPFGSGENVVLLPLVSTKAGDTFLLALSATDDVSGVESMRISHREDFLGAVWIPYTESAEWEASTQATKVYVQFSDSAGNLSDVVSDDLPGR